MAFNGEIYNHQELRQNLGSGRRWRGHSDTETLLELISSVGIERALRQCRGMFALALWDRRMHMLTLARDRVGEKPLYYAVTNQTVLVCSELKALEAFPGFPRDIDHESLALYFRLGYIPAPRSIWSGVRKVSPGEIVTLKAGMTGLSATQQTYWSLADEIVSGAGNPFDDEETAGAAVMSAIDLAVAEQLQADVPVGAFLSGGIDSALVVASAARQSSRQLMTFTIGHFDSRFDESNAARQIASHLGTEHIELRITADDALAVVPRLPEIYDEPLADSSAIPTLLVSRLARRHVKVVLTGDGGDEFFGGYQSYTSCAGIRRWRRWRAMPLSFRQLAIAGCTSSIPCAFDRLFARMGREFGFRWQHSASAWCDLTRAVIASRSVEEYFCACSSKWLTPPLRERSAAVQSMVEWGKVLPNIDPIRAMMAIDATGVLPGDILAKVDRATMAASLEARAPLLDRRIIELAQRVPIAFNVRGGMGKMLLRTLVAAQFPPHLATLPKRGFSIPLCDWLRGPLRDWAEDLLSVAALESSNQLDPTPIRAVWQSHLAGRGNFSAALWTALTWQDWARRRPEQPANVA